MVDRSQLIAKARELLSQNAKLKVAAPDFGDDKTWLNVAKPLSLANDLRGKLVLLDFWTYCCINCMHVLEDLEYLEHKYDGAPFAVIGCHSAKFANEAHAAHVRQAVLREGIEHPVVVDVNFDIWKRYSIKAWPTLVLISPEGTLLGQISGEGQRVVLEALIDQALELYANEPAKLDARRLPPKSESELEFARELAFPGKVIVNPATRELLIADTNHDRIVVTTLEGKFVRAFGSGASGFADGPAHAATFRRPQGMVLGEHELFVADTHNHAIRRVDLSTGAVTTVAGNGKQGYEKSGSFGARDIGLNSPWDLALAGRTLYIAMAGPHQIWKLDLVAQKLEPAFGSGNELRLDGPAKEAGFAQPSGLALEADYLFVADSEASSIRICDLKNARVGTIAGGDANPRDLFHFGDQDGTGPGRRFQHPLGLAFQDAMLYVADTYNHKVKYIDLMSATVTSFAGDGEPGSADGPVEDANFREPSGLAAFERWLFVADTNNHAIRVIDLETHEVRTLRLSGVPIPSATIIGGAASIDGSPLPQLPNTIDHGVVAATLAPGNAEIELRLALGPGESLAPNAPSQYRVLHDFGLTAAKSISGPIREPRTALELGVMGAGRLFVQILYYVCDAAGLCHLRSGRWTLEIKTDAKGAKRVVLEATQAS